MTEIQLAKVNTPKSITIIIIGMVIGVSALYFIPKLPISSFAKTWAQIISSGLTVALLRTAQNSMSERPEINEDKLSPSDLSLKQKLKNSFKIIAVAYLTLVFVIAGCVMDSTHQPPQNPKILTLSLSGVFLVWLVGLGVGVFYNRKFVTR